MTTINPLWLFSLSVASGALMPGGYVEEDDMTASGAAKRHVWPGTVQVIMGQQQLSRPDILAYAPLLFAPCFMPGGDRHTDIIAGAMAGHGTDR